MKARSELVAVLEQQPFELDGILERTAVGHHAGGIDHGVLADALRDLLAGAPLADGVVVVPGESQRVDLRVAGGAVRVVAVRFDLLAKRGLGAFRRVGFDGAHVRRWRRGRLAENRFADPDAAVNRAMAGAVRGQPEHRAHRQQTAAMILGLERDALEAVGLRLRQPVEIAEPGVGHGPVGIDEAVDGQVLREHLAEILDGLGTHARLKPGVVRRVQLLVRREHADAVQLQPLPWEVVDEAVDLAVRQQPVHLLLQAFAVQGAAFGRGEEAVVGHRTPEEIREPGGEFPVVETFAGHRVALDEVDEVPGGQHALHRDAIGIGRLFARLAFGAVRLQIVLPVPPA